MRVCTDITLIVRLVLSRVMGVVQFYFRCLEVSQNDRHGATFSTDYFVLFILLSADVVVLLSETVNGLQTQLNS